MVCILLKGKSCFKLSQVTVVMFKWRIIVKCLDVHVIIFTWYIVVKCLDIHVECSLLCVCITGCCCCCCWWWYVASGNVSLWKHSSFISTKVIWTWRTLQQCITLSLFNSELQGRIIHETGEASLMARASTGARTARYNENLQSRTTLGPIFLERKFAVF